MNYLLDTHTFLWWCAADKQLSSTAITIISDAQNHIFVSAVSGWEIAIKSRLGKLPLPDKPNAFMAAMLKLHAFEVLEISMRHAVAEYELDNHHSDPFDRLLISQAKLEDLTLITNDSLIAKYNVETVW